MSFLDKFKDKKRTQTDEVSVEITTIIEKAINKIAEDEQHMDTYSYLMTFNLLTYYHEILLGLVNELLPFLKGIDVEKRHMDYKHIMELYTMITPIDVEHITELLYRDEIDELEHHYLTKVSNIKSLSSFGYSDIEVQTQNGTVLISYGSLITYTLEKLLVREWCYKMYGKQRTNLIDNDGFQFKDNQILLKKGHLTPSDHKELEELIGSTITTIPLSEQDGKDIRELFEEKRLLTMDEQTHVVDETPYGTSVVSEVDGVTRRVITGFIIDGKYRPNSTINRLWFREMLLNNGIQDKSLLNNSFDDEVIKAYSKLIYGLLDVSNYVNDTKIDFK